MRLVHFLLLMLPLGIFAQVPVDVSGFDKKGKVQLAIQNNLLSLTWPAGGAELGKLSMSLLTDSPLIQSLEVGEKGSLSKVGMDLDAAFVINVGKRDLVSQNGWNIFFDRTAYLPHKEYTLSLKKNSIKVTTTGSRTRIKVGGAAAGPFGGEIEIVLFNGSPLLNIAAALTTEIDSLAIIYDAGLESRNVSWDRVVWSDPDNFVRDQVTDASDQATDLAVKYRTIIGENAGGSLAVFPAPHQYFYPLDNCYNLKHTWFGKNYRGRVKGYGLGIRHDLLGDRRWVPWFNAPPRTVQRLNFFCLLSKEKDGKVLDKVKEFTNGDTYKVLPGHYTLASHFHQEHVDDILTHKPIPAMPGFVKALRNTGVNIVHLGEFHGPGSPRGPEVKRWPELQTLFEECRRLSDGNFLLLPGEEPNNFFGGHWMNIFPRPVYWLMSRTKDQPYVENHPVYGKLYRIGSKEDMLRLLEDEKGLAWTAHARTKGSTGFPDKYKDEAFYQSDRFLGAAWKAMPADLSESRLGIRVLDLMDDMANWGQKKNVLAEADLFRIEPDYELYGHLNVNYLQLDRMPRFEEGWQPVLDALRGGRFFVSTGEVLLPAFKVNGKAIGEMAAVDAGGKAEIELNVRWTFPLHQARVVSGDGKDVFHHDIDLSDTESFGEKTFRFAVDLKNRKWVRVEVWDAAVNGAFTQIIWLK